MGETDIKRKFTKTMNWSRKFHDTNATRIFLNDCITQDIIPKTFRIRNEPLSKCSDRHKDVWTSGSRMASKMWMESSILDLESKCEDLRKAFLDSKENLLEKIPDRNKHLFERNILNKDEHHCKISNTKKSKKTYFFVKPEFLPCPG
jgi:hypothetical protein